MRPQAQLSDAGGCRVLIRMGYLLLVPCAQVTAAMKHMEQNPSKGLPVVVVTITKETMMALRTDMCAETWCPGCRS